MSKQAVMTLREKMDAQKDGSGYIKLHKYLMSSTAFINPVTGEVVEWSPMDKVVYMYLVDKVSFHLSRDEQMFESFAYIGRQLGVSAKTADRSVKKLIEGGAVKATLEGRSKGYVYTGVVIDLELVTPESCKQVSSLITPIKAKGSVKVKPTPAVVEEFKTPPAVKESGTETSPWDVIEESADPIVVKDLNRPLSPVTSKVGYSTMPDGSDDSELSDLPKVVPDVEDVSDFDDEFLNSIGMQAGQ